MLYELRQRLQNRSERRLFGVDLITAAISLKIPLAGALLGVVDKHRARTAHAALQGEVDLLRAELHAQRQRAAVVAEDMQKILDDLRAPSPDRLERAFDELKALHMAQFTTPMFEGLLKDSPHYQQMVEQPGMFGRILRYDERLSEGAIPFFIERGGAQQILEISPFTLRQLIGRSVRGRAVSVGGGVLGITEEDQTAGALATCSAGIRWRFIPPGSFQMGSIIEERRRALTWLPKERRAQAQEQLRSESPRHRVTLSQGFWMTETPVTQGTWRSLTGVNPSRSRRGARHPIDSIDWFDAARFSNRLSEHLGLEQAYRFKGRSVGWRRAEGVRLPTEAEWEYACRAGTSTAFWSGETRPSLARAGWSWESCDPRARSTQPVGQKIPNAWGLRDTHGQVWEWCWDYYGAYSGRNQLDPRGPTEGVARVFRGGSWSNNAEDCRAASRRWVLPSQRYNTLGVRLVMEALPR